MPCEQTNPEQLVAALKAKSQAPPDRRNQLLVRHLRCKESLSLADALTGALTRYHAHDAHVLSAPTEVLPPLQ
ncbi:MAG TPA: hypothetical protein VMB66_09255 [Candidatus Acidoferrales bacterium]|nr:hypothetical protein [Candidatus Acidoferrales bacterium]